MHTCKAASKWSCSTWCVFGLTLCTPRFLIRSSRWTTPSLDKVLFFLYYVLFHLTASFHTSPRGPQSGVSVVHVTVIIFFKRDKDMDSSDSAYSPLEPRPCYCSGTLRLILTEINSAEANLSHIVYRNISCSLSHIVRVHEGPAG